MSEQTMRERIRDAMKPGWDFGYEDDIELQDEIIANCIAIIREAMLAPSVVKAAHRGVPPPCQIERVLTNALNEVFGE